mmetsp:Transcript_149193/g.479167  ORF Transcript_149193/g.479167 Transcript_149193/m.479167 type:complete len:229 (-) Transcript_149193:2-688(-)
MKDREHVQDVDFFAPLLRHVRLARGHCLQPEDTHQLLVGGQQETKHRVARRDDNNEDHSRHQHRAELPVQSGGHVLQTHVDDGYLDLLHGPGERIQRPLEVVQDLVGPVVQGVADVVDHIRGFVRLVREEVPLSLHVADVAVDTVHFLLDALYGLGGGLELRQDLVHLLRVHRVTDPHGCNHVGGPRAATRTTGTALSPPGCRASLWLLRMSCRRQRRRRGRRGQCEA